MSFSNINTIWLQALILSLFVLVGNPIIVFAISKILGFKKRVSFLTGIILAQISEFSLILVALGQKFGHLSADVVSTVTLVGLITMTISVYMIYYKEKIYKIFNPFLSMLEGHVLKDSDFEKIKQVGPEVILIGCHRMGMYVLDSLIETGKKVFVIDADPNVIKKLDARKIPALFADIDDYTVRENLPLAENRILVSTVPSIEDNLALLTDIKKRDPRIKMIVYASDKHGARLLYKRGADYVVVPRFVGGRHIAYLLRDEFLANIDQFRKKEIELMGKD